MRATTIPANTNAATDWCIKIWEAENRANSTADQDVIATVTTPLLQMSPADLAYWLGKFVLEDRKDSTEYPPKSLYARVCCFKKHFEKNGVHCVNILFSLIAQLSKFSFHIRRKWVLLLNVLNP